MSPQQFTEIRQKIESSPMLSAEEKKEWLFLLPRMSADELKELDRILSLGTTQEMPEPGSFIAKARPLTPERSDGGRARPPNSAAQNLVTDIERRGPRRPEYASAPQGENPALTRIAMLGAEDIRKPPSIYVCLENVHKEIKVIMSRTDISSKQILEAFQRSPLYRDYLTSGMKLINNDPNTPLSHEEFEAVADFHGNLKDLVK